MNAIKRDGREVTLERRKIANAILAASNEVGKKKPSSEITQEDLTTIVERLVSRYKKRKRSISVEDIQEDIETELMKAGYYDIAKAYIRYRYLHNIARNQYKDLMSSVAEKLSASNVQNQNANVDEHSFGGRLGEANEAVTKKYALEYCVSSMAKSNHLNNRVYIHDLGHYAVGDHNCLTVPLDKLLANGFAARQTDVRPAQSVSTAFQQVAVIFQIQSLQQFGGVSSSHLDWTMVPYVRKSFWKHFKDGLKYIQGEPVPDDSRFDINTRIDADIYKVATEAYQYAIDMTERETNQAVEAMYHNLNTLQSRSGNQLPFSSINYGTCTLPEGRMVTKALLNASIDGTGKLHKTSVFPCGIFQCMKGVNRKPGDPNYDLFLLALKSTSKRLYPNYANIDWSNNAGYDKNDPRTYFSTMGCRTANLWDINGFGQLKDGRGNICPVTIIMPTLAMEAKEQMWNQLPESSKKRIIISPYEWTKGECAVIYFMKLLDKKIREAKDMLIERFEWICSQSPKSAQFMYENGTMEGYIPEEGIRSALKHGTLAIGQLGLAETLQILIGCDHTTEKGMELAKRIEQLFKDRCDEFKKKYKLNFGVYYTPECNI